MYPSTKFQPIWRKPDYGTKFAQRAWVTKILENKLQNRYKYILMCPCNKFQLIWRTSDYGTEFAQKIVSDKNIGKINIKFEITI